MDGETNKRTSLDSTKVLEAGPCLNENNAAAPRFAEDIRLVIWDLDETFWSGTLTEGGIGYIAANHEIVIELAKRGIMSSICSKNDFADIEVLLQEKGLWDSFIFPSVNWNPKAPRIAQQIANIGLRPPTVLFIDDNPQNLQQAADHIPGLNIATPDIISGLLSHPQLKGKPDPELTRLKQYKNNEKKYVAQNESDGDNIAFLRKSDVRVYFEYEVEKHLDRVIELINRTNQLNFTKVRLSEDFETAKNEILPLIRHTGTTAGLVRVVDKFGDYGFVGFFAMTDFNHTKTLKHFCFSCRTLNMYIEHFVYNYLKRPDLEVVGDVLSDLRGGGVSYDWIRVLPISSIEDNTAAPPFSIDSMYVRGGCDLSALMHYFTLNCKNITTEFNYLKDWQPLRLDHSSFLLAALNGLTDEQIAAAQTLGYQPEDFVTTFPTAERPVNVSLLSFWADTDIPYYRHKETGLEVPYFVVGAGKENMIADDATVDRLGTNEIQRARIERLKAGWEYHYGFTHEEMVARYRAILCRIPADTQIFMTVANERHPAYFADAEKYPRDPDHIAYNRALREAVSCFDNVRLIDLNEYVNKSDDVLDLNHLRRDLYFKIYEEIIECISAT